MVRTFAEAVNGFAVPSPTLHQTSCSNDEEVVGAVIYNIWQEVNAF